MVTINEKSRIAIDSVGIILLVVLQCQLIHEGNALSASTPASVGRIDTEDRHDNELRLRRDLGLSLDGGKSLHNYSHILPPHNDTSPVTIQIGLSVILVRQLDARSRTLTIETWLKLVWTDKRFSWKDEDYGDLNVLRVPDHNLWQPDIKIYNAAHASEIDMKNDVYCLLYNNGEVIWIPPATLNTICEVDLRNYPYDSHWCSIKMGSWTHNGFHMDLQLYNEEHRAVSLEDLFSSAGEWEIIDTDAKRTSTKYPCCMEEYIDVTFRLNLRRRSPLYGVTILCPVVAALFLALVSFWLPPYAYERITVNSVSLVTMVLVLMHLANTIPSVGSRSPIIVAFCGNFTVLVSISMSASVFILSFLRNRQHEPVPHWVHVALRSRLATICCVSSSRNLGIIGTDTATLEVLQDSEDPHRQPSGEMRQIDDRNQWVCFFQMVDRIAFALFTFVTLVVIIVSSA